MTDISKHALGRLRTYLRSSLSNFSCLTSNIVVSFLCQINWTKCFACSCLCVYEVIIGQIFIMTGLDFIQAHNISSFFLQKDKGFLYFVRQALAVPLRDFNFSILTELMAACWNLLCWNIQEIVVSMFDVIMHLLTFYFIFNSSASANTDNIDYITARHYIRK